MRKSGEPSAAVRTKPCEPLMIVVALITNRPASTMFRAANRRLPISARGPRTCHASSFNRRMRNRPRIGFTVLWARFNLSSDRM